MKNRDWMKWIRCAIIRAAKTVAEAAIAGIGTATAMGQVDWKYIFSVSMLSGLLSVLISVKGLPELDK